MRRILSIMAVLVWAATSVHAQKIKVVDEDGYGIPLVSVQTEDGVCIGTTDLDGVLADVRGNARVSLTHVSYKPQVVTVSQLQDGTVKMEEVDYGLQEIVVKPKPYLFMEYYYRAFSYIGDSLRIYSSGIIPVVYDIKDKYKGKIRSNWAYGGAANKALSWNVETMELIVEKNVKGVKAIETLSRESEKFKDYYKVSVEPDGENRWVLKNPEGVVGHFFHDDGQYRATLDGSKMQIYANRVNGEDRKLKSKEARNYGYQYSEVYDLDDEGKIQPYNKVMELNHWEYDKPKGRMHYIVYLYVTDRGYMEYDEFKARSKALNKGYAGNMPLAELEKYEKAHNIPDLAPSQQTAIKQLKKRTGEKNKGEKEDKEDEDEKEDRVEVE